MELSHESAAEHGRGKADGQVGQVMQEEQRRKERKEVEAPKLETGKEGDDKMMWGENGARIRLEERMTGMTCLSGIIA